MKKPSWQTPLLLSLLSVSLTSRSRSGRELLGEVGAEVILGVVHGAAHGPPGIGPAPRDVEQRALAAPACREAGPLVWLGLEEPILPVEILKLVERRVPVVAEVLQDVARLLFPEGVQLEFDPLVPVHEVEAPRLEALPPLVAQRDPRLARAPRLGRDDDDAVGRLRPVDRGGRGVLQDLDRGDVFGSDGVQRGPVCKISFLAEAHLHAVDDVERVVPGVDRACATDVHLEAPARVAAGGGDLHAGRPPLEERLRALHRDVLDLLAAHVRNRAGHVGPALGAVPGDHHLVEADGPRLQLEVLRQRLPGSHRDLRLGGLVPDEARAQGVGPGRQVADRVAPLRVGRRAAILVHEHHVDAGDRLTGFGVRDGPRDAAGLLRGRGEREQEEEGHSGGEGRNGWSHIHRSSSGCCSVNPPPRRLFRGRSVFRELGASVLYPLRVRLPKACFVGSGAPALW